MWALVAEIFIFVFFVLLLLFFYRRHEKYVRNGFEYIYANIQYHYVSTFLECYALTNLQLRQYIEEIHN